MTMETYFTKSGYQPNLAADGRRIEQYTKMPENDPYQTACYRYAAKLIRHNSWQRCLELGSGSGYKLQKFIRPLARRVVGIDLPHSVEHCRRVYPSIQWLAEDFDVPEPALKETFDLVMSFDVIEHLLCPEKLLDKIAQYSNRHTRALISTPERDRARGPADMGPPQNRLHVREWNRDEFARFVRSRGFRILRHRILPAKTLTLPQTVKNTLLLRTNRTCQLVECVVE
jgi:2-polyprenyl-3-methyl-5-hydroxy-6-metoxy-1,4-benzoquinol methylase